MDLVLVIDHVDPLPVLQDVVLELNKLLWLAHGGVIRHTFDLSRVGINDETLRSEVSVQETPENHYLRVVDRKGAKLAAFGITAGAGQIDVLPVCGTIEVV